MAAYAASKSALIGLTRALAAEIGPHGIRLNALLPGRTLLVDGGVSISRSLGDAA
jgi:NAD(P)-dependent dehydrogenase (short-subunit alcohol dehydrogenase family)